MNTRRFLCALAAALVLAAGAEAEEQYPTFGMCTGENVRLREAPDTSTNSNITGRLNDLDRFVVVGETAVDGAVWYEVEHPDKKGTAWVFGKYVDTYKGDGLGTPAFAMQVRIAQSFGLTPARARVIFGAPKEKKEEKFWFEPGAMDMVRVVLTYPTHRAEYLDGTLQRVDVTTGTMPFGEIRIGDPETKLHDLLGDPNGEDEDGQFWEIDPMNVLYFKVKGGRVASMSFVHYLDA